MDFEIIQDSQTITCQTLFTFKDETTNVDYIVYTDGSKNDDDSLKIYASRYVFEDNNIVLKEIENDSEWDMIDEMISIKFEETK